MREDLDTAYPRSHWGLYAKQGLEVGRGYLLHVDKLKFNLSGIYRRAWSGKALRILPIPEGRAVDSAVDAASGLSLCSAMFLPASLIPEK